jgi:isoleucyl-tRNA synthetase
MPFVKLPEVLKTNPRIRPENMSALIWTTTPWTLPANKAIAIKSDLEYCIVESAELGRDQMLVAKDRIEHVLSHLPEGAAFEVVVDSIPGSHIADGQAACFNLFSAGESPILHGDFVTATSGTGLVHIAPGHGMEDYQLCQQKGIGPAFAPVDDDGRFTADAFAASADGSALKGLDVQTKGAKAVLSLLESPGTYLPKGLHDSHSSLVLAAHKFIHKNPIDWRTKQPVITRATAQWFADTSAIKDRALAALDTVQFIPESGRSRLKSFIAGRSQWCISRQRVWGVPLPALYNVENGEACVSDESINHIISVIHERGIDAWFSDAIDDPAWLHSSLEPGKWVRGRDTMDVWFDSGSSWTSLTNDGIKIRQSDVYVEGTDQHRGWFQSSLLTAIATQKAGDPPVAPFRKLVTHGFTLDAEGRKMSKSLGNVVSPEEIISGVLVQLPKAGKNKGKPSKPVPTPKSQNTSLGPDVLRLWVASSDYTKDVSISQPVLRSVQQALQKYRVTFKFLLGVLHDYPSPTPQENLARDYDFADQVILHQVEKTAKAVHEAYRDYKFYAGVNEINRLINLDLSAFYFEIVKDRLYTGSTATRRHTQTILLHIMHQLTRMLAPVTPHLIEEVWQWAPEALKPKDPTAPQPWNPNLLANESPRADLENALDVFQKLRSAVKIAQEDARADKKLGSSLACQVQLHLPRDLSAVDWSSPAFGWLRNDTELADLLVVSRAKVVWWDAGVEGRAAGSSPSGREWETSHGAQLGCPSGSQSPTAVVLPPDEEKCVRCWKYVAEEPDVPCPRCRDVLAETMV